MPRQVGKFSVNSFVGGFISDFHELDFPQNVTTDEGNCELDRHGSRRRRFGIDFEEDYLLSDTDFGSTDFSTMYIKTSNWEAVNNNGNVNFLVIQLGSTLSYYDMTREPLSGAELPFTTDLQDHTITSAHDDTLGQFEVQCVSGKGVLFVAGSRIIPFYVTYDEDTNTITETEIDIRTRDLKLQSGKTDYEDQPQSIDYKLRYDYFNQGWYISNIYAGISGSDKLITVPLLDWYYSKYPGQTASKHNAYPPLSKIWWIGQAAPDGDKHNHTRFDIAWYKTPYVGNLLAPLGHYIVDPFNLDRSGVSGIPGFSIERSNDRPSTVAFYAGKVFYGWKNQIIFSQTLIDDFSATARCYQQADPTAEDINNLVATDGGVIPLQYSGEIVAFVPYENSLLIFCTNGIWALGGSNIGQGFSADNFAIYKVSSVGAISSRTIVDVEGVPYFWSKTGIYAVTPVPAKQGFDVVNICQKKIQFFYDDIPGTSKQNASGTYDRLKRRIVWMYDSTGEGIGGNQYQADSILNYDVVLQAFSKYTVGTTDGSDAPYISDVFHLYDISRETLVENVVDSSDVIVTDEADENVTVDRTIVGNFTNELGIGHKFLVIFTELEEGAKVTFADFHDQSFTDWVSVDTFGIDYTSFLEVYYIVPDPMAWSQFPYLFVYVENSTFGDVTSGASWQLVNDVTGATSMPALTFSGASYSPQDVVIYQNNYYTALTNTSATPTGATDANWYFVGQTIPGIPVGTHAQGYFCADPSTGKMYVALGNTSNNDVTDTGAWHEFLSPAGSLTTPTDVIIWTAGTYGENNMVWHVDTSGSLYYVQVTLPFDTIVTEPGT